MVIDERPPNAPVRAVHCDLERVTLGGRSKEALQRTAQPGFMQIMEGCRLRCVQVVPDRSNSQLHAMRDNKLPLAV